MDILGIDIARAKFDVALLVGERVRHSSFSNTEAGFEQLLVWLARYRLNPDAPVHACMEATGNWGLDLAAFLHSRQIQVSIVNPARIKACGDSELARNRTDRLDAALTARFCRAHTPPAWTPPAPHLRELRELVRRLVAADPVLSKNLALLRGITGFGEISATILMAELPNVEPRGSPDIAEFTPKALAAFAGLSPSEHSSGSSVRKPGRISRIGSERLRSALYMCALSAKRTNKALAAFVGRLIAGGKPPKVILIAVARKLLVFAHAVIRTQKPFDPFPDAPKTA